MLKRILGITAVFLAVTCFHQGMLHAVKPEKLMKPPQLEELGPITKEDRILIMAPHPDDEALGTAGLIQDAVRVGADVSVLYLTNGEHNQLAFIVYEKRIVIKQKAIIQMGELRQREAINAMKSLGVPESKLNFLGYPDFGTLAIFLRYWGEVKPFKNMLLRSSSVPYVNAVTPNAPYKGESILWDIETVLRRYKPTKIFVTSTVDTNRDHRALSLFLQVALWEIKGQIPEPAVLNYIIHCYGWPKPRNYHPDMYLPVPALLSGSQMKWKMLKLTDEQVDKKHKAILMYKSQCADSAFYLTAFARKNELFGAYPVIELDKHKDRPDPFETATQFKDQVVTYGRLKDKLVVSVFFGKSLNTNHNFYVYLVGYKSGKEFAEMPKIKLNISKDRLQALDRGKFINSEKIDVDRRDRSITVKVPLDMLDGPQWLLTSVSTYSENFQSDLNAWRVLKVE